MPGQVLYPPHPTEELTRYLNVGRIALHGRWRQPVSQISSPRGHRGPEGVFGLHLFSSMRSQDLLQYVSHMPAFRPHSVAVAAGRAQPRLHILILIFLFSQEY